MTGAHFTDHGMMQRSSNVTRLVAIDTWRK